MIKNKQFTIPADIYGKDVVFFIGMSDARFNASIEKLIIGGSHVNIKHLDMTVGDGHTAGLTVALPSGAALIRLPAYDDNNYVHRSTVAHEILHAITHILRTCVMPLNEGSEEAYTYMMSFFIREFYRNIGIGNGY